MKKVCIKPVFLRVCALFLLLNTLIGSNTAFAQGDWGWRWLWPTMAIRDLTPQLTASLGAHLTNEIEFATDINVIPGPSHVNPPYSGDLAYVPLSIGSVSIIAVAVPVNSFGDSCSDPQTGTVFTALCPSGATDIDFGGVFVNTNHITAVAPTVPERNFIVLHEAGHILGLSHSTCNPWAILFNTPLPPNSVMAPHPDGLGCEPPHQLYQIPELLLLQSWYP
ncbi:MAG: hypothetical protein WDZ52_10590 [Pseudohongiellaceae bacterium]